MKLLFFRQNYINYPHLYRFSRSASSTSTQIAETKKKSYTNTVFLPKTKFPLRLANKKLCERDENIRNTADFDALYTWQRAHLSEPEFVLHDGPPYANGKLHMGHAINKILKDTILRYQLLRGHKVHYTPGWDCHGLPIELKALSGNTVENPLEIRNKARNFANETIEDQKAGFKYWGVMGDWQNSYATFKPQYYKKQLQIFYKLLKKKLIYRDVKPVFWSPSTKTALAEAELEYNDKFRSPSITVRLEVDKSTSELLKNFNENIYALIWTTTPWTLPANQAISYNPALKYCLIRKTGENNLYIIAEDLLENVTEMLGGNFEKFHEFPSDAFVDLLYTHPVYKEKKMRFFRGAHVSASKGSGLVHTAPAHGSDDFLIALANKLPIVDLVDDLGRYRENAGKNLHGKYVLQEGNETIYEILGDSLMSRSEIVHSYPCDWRTKEPVIIRASQQWFLDTDSIKHRALELLDEVKIYPTANADIYRRNLVNQIKSRPYWCISRQRKWGVPLPIFTNKLNNAIITNEDVITHLCGLIDKYGTDFWWSLPMDELLPSELRGGVALENIQQNQDILDIWFDSGVSWACVLDGNKVADMYLEGVDQCTGWFQSALITSVALRDKAPYRALYVNGFVVDENGLKMSKSLGNVIDPVDIVRGAKKAYGVDVLRWWVVCHANQHPIAHISENVLKSCEEEVQKIRSVLRFAIGSLSDYKKTAREPTDSLALLDKYMLHLLYRFEEKSRESIDGHLYHRINLQLNNFLTNSISALYYTAIKDRLYCDGLDDVRRRSAQYVLLEIFECVCRTIAPILPHLVEEMWSYLPCNNGGKHYFMSDHKKEAPVSWLNRDVEEFMKVVLEIRKEINKRGNVNSYLGRIDITKSVWALIEKIGSISDIESDMCDILQLSKVELKCSENLEGNFNVELVLLSEKHICPRCRRVQSDLLDALCSRCGRIVDLLT